MSVSPRADQKLWHRTMVLALAGVSPVAIAGVVSPGDTVDLDPGAAVESWTIGTGGTLSVNGATTLGINATSAVTLNVSAGGTTGSVMLNGSGATATISDSSITGGPGSFSGFSISSGTATIQNSSISAEGIGLRLNTTSGLGGSVVGMTGGSITGGEAGVALSSTSQLSLEGVTVSGTDVGSDGIRSFNGDLVARNSTVTGRGVGIHYIGAPGDTPGTLVLDNTAVTGQDGAALRITGEFNPGTSTRVEILNGSTLSGGNGNVLEVNDNAIADVQVSGSELQGNIVVARGSDATLNFDRAALTGDISVDATSTGSLGLANGSSLQGNLTNLSSVTLDGSRLEGDISVTDGRASTVALRNASVFTGRLSGVSDLSLESNSTWNLIDNQQLENLALNDGIVNFGSASQHYQLDITQLSGNGIFVMGVDWANNQHDVLNVTGTATGSHILQVAGSGVDPANPQALTLVHMAAGDATFALSGNQWVDVGTYSYRLQSQADGSGGTDWFLDPGTSTVSPSTRSVLALFNTAPTVWYGELTSLRTRMGELRFNGGKAGAWMRSYSNKYDVSPDSGMGYNQVQSGLSLGADAPLSWGDGQWLVGALVGHSRSDLDLSRGTSGSVDSYYAGLYTTWIDPASGYYFDAVLKANRFHNKSKVSMSDDTRAKGAYDNVGLGGSVEFGRHVALAGGWFVEPFGQLSAVTIQGKDYGLDNGMQAEGEQTHSLLGKVGSLVGRNLHLEGGAVVQPYVKAALAHELAKANRVKVNDNLFNNDLSGSRAELGAGVAVAFTERFSVHADLDYAKGEHIEQPYGVNVGLRYSW